MQDATDWWEDDDVLEEAAHAAQQTLTTPAQLPPCARFKDGPVLHVQFDGGSIGGVGTGGFVIIDSSGKEIVRVGHWFGQ
ncbi:MAG: hypothetical protein MJA30_08235 [Cytophagales bacterium]|nr:hypothetical protein [Cytophagales bacterium]